MKIFLVGLPGSGKSTISKELANTLNFSLIDTDDLICEREKTSIDEIFKNKGEDYFRNLEKEILHETLSKENVIISTGGGLPYFFNNMDVINQNGVSLFLNVNTSAIAERLWSHENQNRPLLKGKTKESLLEFLDIKLEERYPYYSKASFTFSGNEITGNDIVKKLKEKKII